MMTTYNDIKLTRDEAERIKWYFDNNWPLTILSGVHNPDIITLSPRDMTASWGAVDMCISARGMDTTVRDVSKVDIAPVGVRGHELRITTRDATVSIPIHWYDYETDDLHPCMSHWQGIWRDRYGYLYAVHEYEPANDWIDEWDTGEEGQPITWPDGAIEYSIYTPDTPLLDIREGSPDTFDGGVIGYEIGDTIQAVLSDWTNNTKLTKIE